MKRRFNRKAVILFLIAFFSASIIVESGMFLIFWNNKNMRGRAYELNAQEAASNLAELFGQALAGGINASNTLFGERWYMHYRNNVEYYQHEFDSDTKYQIWNSLRSTVASLTYIADIVMFTPSMNSAICRNGWFTLPEYQRLYGDIEIDAVQPFVDTFGARATDNAKSVIVLQDYNTRKYKTIVCVLIDNKAMESALNKLVSPSVAYASISLGEQALFESGGLKDVEKLFVGMYNYPALKVVLGYTPMDNAAELMIMILASIIAILAISAFSALLTRHAVKPMANMVLEYGGQPDDLSQPYEYVRMYIEKLRENELKLNREKRDVQLEMDSFLDRARGDIVYGMLTNRRFRFDDANVLLALPWLNDDMNICLLALESGGARADAPRLPESALECAAHTVAIHTELCECAVLWLEHDLSDEETAEFMAYARKEWSRASGRMCMVSGVIRDKTALADEYSRLTAQLTRGLSERTALSEDARARLSEYAQDGDMAQLRAFAERLRADYAISDILCALNAIFLQKPAKLALDADADEAALWRTTLSQVEALISESAGESAAIAQKYLEYIDRNYADPNLSMTTLSDAFDRHRTLLSKDIKAASGLTFTDYLRERRMKAALEKIDSGRLNVMDVAREVGYTSYSTFKRAFIQTVGCTPTDYRKQISSVE